MARSGSPEMVPRNVLACVLHFPSSKKYFCLIFPLHLWKRERSDGTELHSEDEKLLLQSTETSNILL